MDLQVGRKVACFQPQNVTAKHYRSYVKQIFSVDESVSSTVQVQARYTKQQSHGICGNFRYLYRSSGRRNRSVPPEENLQRRRSTLHEAWTTVYLKRGSFSLNDRDEMRHETMF